MPRILLIEDDRAISSAIKDGLRVYGMTVDHFDNAKDGALALFGGEFDAVLLDLTLPEGDGMTVLAHWRTKGVNVPVLIITARDAIANRVAGLNAGADDYLVKPFALDEVVARLMALIRRSQGRSSPVITYGAVSYNPSSRQVWYHGNAVDLTAKEIALLDLMLANPQKIHSRADLEDKLYGWESDIDSNAIEVHVHHLRKKLGNQFILTKRGIGYYLNPNINS